MKPLPIIVLVAIAAIIVYIHKAWRRTSAVQADMDLFKSTQPASSRLQPTENDKLVMVTGVSYDELRRAVDDFCKLYNGEKVQVLPRVTKLSANQFVISFPYDIEFETFCYFINYLKYPFEGEWMPGITGWVTTQSYDTWIGHESANKKVMLFVPDNDQEYDNVYMTTSGNIGYKLGFGMETGELLTSAPRPFSPPPLDISELANKEFEDFGNNNQGNGNNKNK